MKTTVNYNELQSAVNGVKSILNKKLYSPILDCILVEISPDFVKLTGTDLDNYLTITIPASGDGFKSFLSSADMLSNFIKPKSTGLVELEYNDEKLTLSNYGRVMVIGAGDPDEYPQPNEDVFSVAFQVSGQIIQSGLSRCFDFTSKDELRQILTGIYIERNETGIRFSATDCHKLTRFTCEYIPGEDDTKFVLNKKSCSYLMKSKLSNVTIQTGKVYTKIESDNMVLLSSIVNGRYPKFDEVIPRDTPITAGINRKELISTLKSIPVINKITKMVVFSFNGKLNIESVDDNLSQVFSTSLPCVKVGEDIKLGFNRDYMVTVLSSLTTDQVNFRLLAPDRAVLIDSDDNTLTLLMPVKID